VTSLTSGDKIHSITQTSFELTNLLLERPLQALLEYINFIFCSVVLILKH